MNNDIKKLLIVSSIVTLPASFSYGSPSLLVPPSGLEAPKLSTLQSGEIRNPQKIRNFFFQNKKALSEKFDYFLGISQGQVVNKQVVKVDDQNLQNKGSPDKPKFVKTGGTNVSVQDRVKKILAAQKEDQEKAMQRKANIQKANEGNNIARGAMSLEEFNKKAEEFNKKAFEGRSALSSLNIRFREINKLYNKNLDAKSSLEDVISSIENVENVNKEMFDLIKLKKLQTDMLKSYEVAKANIDGLLLEELEENYKEFEELESKVIGKKDFDKSVQNFFYPMELSKLVEFSLKNSQQSNNIDINGLPNIGLPNIGLPLPTLSEVSDLNSVGVANNPPSQKGFVADLKEAMKKVNENKQQDPKKLLLRMGDEVDLSGFVLFEEKELKENINIETLKGFFNIKDARVEEIKKSLKLRKQKELLAAEKAIVDLPIVDYLPYLEQSVKTHLEAYRNTKNENEKKTALFKLKSSILDYKVCDEEFFSAIYDLAEKSLIEGNSINPIIKNNLKEAKRRLKVVLYAKEYNRLLPEYKNSLSEMEIDFKSIEEKKNRLEERGKSLKKLLETLKKIEEEVNIDSKHDEEEVKIFFDNNVAYNKAKVAISGELGKKAKEGLEKKIEECDKANKFLDYAVLAKKIKSALEKGEKIAKFTKEDFLNLEEKYFQDTNFQKDIEEKLSRISNEDQEKLKKISFGSISSESVQKESSGSVGQNNQTKNDDSLKPIFLFIPPKKTIYIKNSNKKTNPGEMLAKQNSLDEDELFWIEKKNKENEKYEEIQRNFFTYRGSTKNNLLGRLLDSTGEVELSYMNTNSDEEKTKKVQKTDVVRSYFFYMDMVEEIIKNNGHENLIKINQNQLNTVTQLSKDFFVLKEKQDGIGQLIILLEKPQKDLSEKFTKQLDKWKEIANKIINEGSQSCKPEKLLTALRNLILKEYQKLYATIKILKADQSALGENDFDQWVQRYKNLKGKNNKFSEKNSIDSCDSCDSCDSPSAEQIKSEENLLKNVLSIMEQNPDLEDELWNNYLYERNNIEKGILNSVEALNDSNLQENLNKLEEENVLTELRKNTLDDVKILSNVTNIIRVASFVAIENSMQDIFAKQAVAAGDDDALMKAKGAWIKGTLGKSSFKDGSSPRSKGSSGGVLFGGDLEIGEKLSLGLSYGRVNSKYRATSFNANLKTDSFSLYGNYGLSSKISLDFNTIYAKSKMNNKRNVHNLGEARSSLNLDSIYLGLGLSYKINLSDNLLFVPNITESYVYCKNDGYKERGAGVYRVESPKYSSSKLITKLGSTLSYAKSTESGVKINPFVKGSFEIYNPIKKDKNKIKLSFTNDYVEFNSVKPKYGYNFGAGLNIEKGRFGFGLEYNYSGNNKKYSSHQGSLKIEAKL